MSSYPAVRGLQDVPHGLNMSFSIERGEFVQILRDGLNHWLSRYFGNQKGAIMACKNRSLEPILARTTFCMRVPLTLVMVSLLRVWCALIRNNNLALSHS